jgi:rhodanese-related sulfurtransferase
MNHLLNVNPSLKVKPFGETTGQTVPRIAGEVLARFCPPRFPSEAHSLFTSRLPLFAGTPVRWYPCSLVPLFAGSPCSLAKRTRCSSRIARKQPRPGDDSHCRGETTMQTISTSQLSEMKQRGDDFLLVNTLDPESFEKTRIPGSINIPQSQSDFVNNVLHESGSKQRLVVVYCASPECSSSSEAARKLNEAGIKVADYDGGAQEWKKAGQPLAT